MADWLAVAEIEPFGEFRADVRAGVVASTIANVHRGKRQKPFQATDFMPFHKSRSSEPQQLFEEIRSFVTGIGKVKKPNGN